MEAYFGQHPALASSCPGLGKYRPELDTGPLVSLKDLDVPPELVAVPWATLGQAAAKITDDLDELLAFYDHPCEPWVHLRTTSPIESTFATVRHRTKVTKGPGSRAAGLAMAFKLIQAAQDRWRAVNAPHLVPASPRRSDLHRQQTRRAT